MTDNSNDTVRQHVDQLGDTPGSASPKDRHAEAGTELRPDWMRGLPDKGEDVDRDARPMPTESEKEGVGSDR
jgi:hypothetical protein